MRIQIHTQGFPLTEAIENRIQRQVEKGLARFEDDLVSLTAYLSDINGPRGGADKKVVMRASMAGLPPVSIATEHGDLYVAIDRTVKRMRRAVRRSLGKSRRVQPRKLLRLRRFSPETAAS